MKPADFIAAIAPAAQACMAETRIPASFTIAEAALESGWGGHAPGMNLFGVKADPSWHGETITLPTTEYVNGRPVRVLAKWRKYPDWQACIDDHASFLTQNERYRSAFEHCDDCEAFAQSVAAAGYATDPNYAAKIIAVIRGHELAQFDRKGG